MTSSGLLSASERKFIVLSVLQIPRYLSLEVETVLVFRPFKFGLLPYFHRPYWPVLAYLGVYSKNSKIQGLWSSVLIPEVLTSSISLSSLAIFCPISVRTTAHGYAIAWA
jgi:hypothetical protein